MQKTETNRRSLSSGEIKSDDWRLSMCVQATGQESLHRWGDERSMREEMQTLADQGCDVWLIDPQGNKYLPTQETSQEGNAGVKPETWRLVIRDKETGRDRIHRWGDEQSMREEMEAMANSCRDVWLIDPQGNKHLPQQAATQGASQGRSGEADPILAVILEAPDNREVTAKLALGMEMMKGVKEVRYGKAIFEPAVDDAAAAQRSRQIAEARKIAIDAQAAHQAAEDEALLAQVNKYMPDAIPEEFRRHHTKQTVVVPNHDSDVSIQLPNGHIMQLQFRPSNADVNSPGTFDIIFPYNMEIESYRGDNLKPSKKVEGGLGHIRKCKQLVTRLPWSPELVAPFQRRTD